MPRRIASRPCVFFDRDGIVNRAPTQARYVRNWGEFELMPGFVEVLRVVAERGYEAVIVTNQRGIATGQMSWHDVDDIHRRLKAALAEQGLRLLDILVCAADDDGHPDRKPNPGMLLEAARRYRLDLRRSWMIGDNEKDVEAGRRTGCRTVLVAPPGQATAADFRAGSMAEVAALLAREL